MNKTLIFLCLSSAILVLSIIVICISPIINNFEVKNRFGDVWSFSKWRTLNCKIYADREKFDTISLDDIQKMKRLKNLCNRKRGMHGLEYTALIIDLIIGIVCTNLSLLIHFNVNKTLAKKAGIIGLIIGIIGFIITFIYVGFSGYIFNNDPAFVEFDSNSMGVKKLYSNGAYYKKDGIKTTTVYSNDKSFYSEYAKFKELGQKQYNYNKKLYQSYYISSDCKISTSASSSCDYIFSEPPYASYANKDLHDRWLTSLILSVFIFACNAGLAIFGFLIFKNGGDSSEEQTVAIS